MILGINLTDEQVIVKSNNNDQVKTYPLIINKLHDNTFEIGQRAYEQSLNNNGILIDKLIYKSIKAKEVLIDNTNYPTYYLFEIFFKNLFLEYGNVEFVCVTVDDNNPILFRDLDTALYHVLDSRDKFIITTNSDSFIKYTSQLVVNKEINKKQSIGLIDFIDKSLVYYELNYRSFEGYKKEFIDVKLEKNAPVPIDLLHENNGIRIVDSILVEFAKKMTQNKEYAYFMISGYGFSNQDSYRDFINYICSLGCPVLKEENLFALGSEIIALDSFNGVIDSNYYYITDSRTSFSITLSDGTTKYQKKICDFGVPWFSTKINFQIIVYNTNELMFNIDRFNNNSYETSILLNNDFDIRSNKTTKLEVKINFLQYNSFDITVEDIGFGEFYEPIESAKTTRTIDL